MSLWLVLLGWALAGGSPGPATLAISATAMGQGRRAGLSVASGVMAGSATWGLAAGLGMSAIMLSHAWMFEIVRYLGAAYLLWLALKSLKSAWTGRRPSPGPQGSGTLFLKGYLIHLTNPKAILSWGAIYAIAIPQGSDTVAVWSLFAALIATSACVFWGYALLFSTPRIARAYAKAARIFDAAFAVLFGVASLRILTSKIA